jgi:hypothetical protein
VAISKGALPCSDSESSPCPDPNQIRPIAVGEVFYRLIAHYLLHSCGDLSLCFPSIQFGFHRAGIDRVIHQARAALELHPDSILITTDFRAAFQTRCRSSIATSVFNQPILSHINRLFHWAYSQPSDLLIFSPDGSLYDSVLSSNGVRQGDVLASIAFAVSVQQLFSSSLSPNSLGLAIIDDFSIVAPSSLALQSFSQLAHNAAACQFPLNKSKCSIFWPHSRPIPDQITEFATLHSVNITHSTASLLGSSISLNSNVLTNWALSKINTLDSYFNILKSPYMRSQMSVALLRLSASPKLNHLCRTLPFSSMQTPCELFDRQCLDVFASRLVLSPDPHLARLAARQIVLPLRDGGFGIGTSSLTLAAASLSSICSAIQDINPLLNQQSPTDKIPLLWQTFVSAFQALQPQHRSHSRAPINRSAVSDVPLGVDLQHFILPDTPETLWSFFSESAVPISFQSILSEPLRNAYRSELLLSASPHDLSRLSSLYGPNISLFLTALPSSPFTSFSDRDFSLICKFRLGIPISGIPLSGKCSLCNSAIPSNPNIHPMCCPKTRRRETLARHNFVVQTLNRHARYAGATTTVEPRPLDEANRKPDLCIIYQQSLYTDVTIVQPDAPSKSSLSSVSALLQAEASKNNKYKSDIEALNHSFIPAAATSYGVFSSSLNKVITQIGLISDQSGYLPPPLFTRTLSTEIACAIQHGNAQILTSAIRAHQHLPSHQASSLLIIPPNSTFSLSPLLTSHTPPSTSRHLSASTISHMYQSDADDPMALATPVSKSKRKTSSPAIPTPSPAKRARKVGSPLSAEQLVSQKHRPVTRSLNSAASSSTAASSVQYQLATSSDQGQLTVSRVQVDRAATSPNQNQPVPAASSAQVNCTAASSAQTSCTTASSALVNCTAASSSSSPSAQSPLPAASSVQVNSTAASSVHVNCTAASSVQVDCFASSVPVAASSAQLSRPATLSVQDRCNAARAAFAVKQRNLLQARQRALVPSSTSSPERRAQFIADNPHLASYPAFQHSFLNKSPLNNLVFSSDFPPPNTSPDTITHEPATKPKKPAVKLNAASPPATSGQGGTHSCHAEPTHMHSPTPVSQPSFRSLCSPVDSPTESFQTADSTAFCPADMF